MCSVRKCVLRNFAKFAGPMPATLLKRRLWHRCFPVNFAKFLRTPVLQNTFGRLLLLLLLVRKVMKVSWVILVSENLFLSFFCHMCLLHSFYYLQKKHDTSAWINKMTYVFNGTSSFWWFLDIDKICLLKDS